MARGILNSRQSVMKKIGVPTLRVTGHEMSEIVVFNAMLDDEVFWKT